MYVLCFYSLKVVVDDSIPIRYYLELIHDAVLYGRQKLLKMDAI